MTVLLYDRLGGYDAIAVFANKLISAAQADDLLGRFWSHRSEDRNARDMQLLIDYLVHETGGQMYYTGRDMRLAHAGMGINEADWQRFLEIVSQIAQALQIPAPEGAEVTAFLDTLKPEIVNVDAEPSTVLIGERH
ncbi:MAG: group 1 truncated hemoglobin [Pseudomonadaceae bacterium]|nr:group 1 truncated hemoglobin [Pseudomonadaceae bacterium]